MLTYDYMLPFKFILLLELERNSSFFKAPRIRMLSRINRKILEKDHAGF
jgi:hypothetical protein